MPYIRGLDINIVPEQQEEFERQQAEHQQRMLQAGGKGKAGGRSPGAVVDGYEEDWETDTVEDMESGVVGGGGNKQQATTGVLKIEWVTRGQ